jgi:RNA polymerase sigma-70 factor (ECF subfamily)
MVSASVTAGPDLEYQRKIYQDEFRIAFADALASLSIRERNLLKQSVLYGATSEDLATLYRVHRTTAGRWLADARTRLASETRNRMVKKLGIDRRGYNSIMRLIESRLDVSVARLLA